MTKVGIGMKVRIATIVGVFSGLIAAPAFGQGRSCDYRGSEYSDGSLSCQGGVSTQCMNGDWVQQGDTCAESSGNASGSLGMESGAEEPSSTDSFMPGDSQAAPSSPDDMP